MRTLRQLRGKYLMVVIAMCGLIASSMGIMTNVAGIFFTPIAEELGTDTASVNLTLTISNMAFAVAGIFSAKWIKPKNFQIAVTVFTLVFAGATALLSVCRSLAALYILNALRGFASGMIGSVLVTSVIGYWFLADTGFISSIALGCSGLAGALFNPILEAVIQSAGWRAAYLAAAGAIMLLNLPAMVTPISYRPEDSGVEPVRNRTEEKAAALKAAAEAKAAPEARIAAEKAAEEARLAAEKAAAEEAARAEPKKKPPLPFPRNRKRGRLPPGSCWRP